VVLGIVSGGSRNDEVSCNHVMAGEGRSVDKGAKMNEFEKKYPAD
jgi:hypothetical protein